MSVDAAAARRLFDANAARYDRVNAIVSLGLDARWRRWVARRAVTRRGARVLDAFAGTGRVGIECAAVGADVTLADASPAMLGEAARYAGERGFRVREVLVDLAAEELPFAAASFDAIAVSFGIRYLDAPGDVLRRLGTLLAPGGRLVVLEFVRPAPGPVSSPAAVYFFRILPRVASALTGRPELYEYLTGSVRRIGREDDLARLLSSSDYDVVERRRAGFGLVAAFVCVPSA